MVIHSFNLAPEEANRIVDAVRRGIGAETVPKIGNVDVVAARHDNRIHDDRRIEVSIFVTGLGEHRTLRFEKDEQSSEEIERRVREKLANL